MKKILILAYDYPPFVSVGALRPYSWFKYMHEFNVFPIIVTRQWSNKYGNHLDYITPTDSSENIYEKSEKGLIIKTPYFPNLSNKLLLKYGDSKFNLLRKAVSAFYEFGQFLLLIGPKSKLYFEAEDYLAKNKVDLIVATGEPFVLFRYASKLSRKYNIPWIADYRDPWTQDKSRRTMGVPEKWDAFLEKRILSKVNAITTVSKFFQRQIESLISNKPFYIVPNGYDPEAIDKVKDVGQTSEKLSIAFVGTVYEWHPIESFLRVCSNFVRERSTPPRFEINFYGTNAERQIRKLIRAKYQNLKPLVNMHPKSSNEQVLEKLAANNVFLLFNYYSYMGTKIYDYLALKRRIILCYADDEETNELKRKYYNMENEDSKDERLQEQVILETNSGVVIKDAAHLRNVLNDLYSEFETKGSIPCDSVDIERYSRKLQVRNLVGVIEKTISIHNKNHRDETNSNKSA